jgi:hypothetical protein
MLTTDVGSFPVPADMAALYAQCRVRKDGQPDRRTKEGREWWAKLREFRWEKFKEYQHR